MTIRHGIAAIILAAAFTLPAAAQNRGVPIEREYVLPDATLLTVTGRGEVKQSPDMAVVSAGVVTQAASATEALAQNRQQMTRVIRALEQAGVDSADIQTSQLNLNPDFRYQENREPVITGYRAENQVRVTLRELEDAGTILDALVAVGANQLSGPNFQVSNEEEALDRARQEAVRTARQRAELYASAAGMQVARIVSISESAGMPQPRPMLAMAVREQADASSPVEPGRLSLEAAVTMVFELR